MTEDEITGRVPRYHTRDEMKAMALKAIRDNKLFFITDVIAFMPFSLRTFYDYELHKSQEIKDLLTQNKIEIKISLRNRWYNSPHPTLQILLYKLIANDEERKRLSQQYFEVSGDANIKHSLDVTKLSDEAIQQIRAAKSRPQLTDGRGSDSD